MYRQPTFCGGFTNFKSLIPTVQRSDLVYALLHRCFNITSSYKKFHNEINALKQILKTNGFSLQLSDRCIKLYVTNAIHNSVNKKQLLIVLPFPGAQWFLVRKRLQSCIRNYLPYYSSKKIPSEKRGKLELNKNIYSYPLEILDWLLL